MKNCLAYCTSVSLRNFILSLGILPVADILRHFDVLTEILILDKDYQKTSDIKQMEWGVMQTEVGYWTKRNNQSYYHTVISGRSNMDQHCTEGSLHEM